MSTDNSSIMYEKTQKKNAIKSKALAVTSGMYIYQNVRIY